MRPETKLESAEEQNVVSTQVVKLQGQTIAWSVEFMTSSRMPN